jgi:hypothetical protein
MIYQIANVKTKTEPLPNVTEGLINARRIQAHIKELVADGLLPENRWQPWSSTTTGRSLVSDNIWFD